MEKLTQAGRWFYGLSMAGIGIHQLFYGEFSVMMVPAWPIHNIAYSVIAYVGNVALIGAGIAIILNKNARTLPLMLGGIFLALLIFSYVPYEFIFNPYYRNIAVWANAFKELAFAGGAFVMAGAVAKEASPSPSFIKPLERIIPFGPWFFSATMICFGIIHFLYLQVVAGLVPGWVPYPAFWAAFAGIALIGSGLSIVFKIKVKIIGNLLGLMILLWFFMLHIPRAIATPLLEKGNEITSAFSALAFSGIAFVIANIERYNAGQPVAIKPVNTGAAAN
jgi:hypothetical protein